MSHHVIIGGSDAGLSAAMRIKELDEAAEVTLVLADEYPGFSICGLPFFLSGEVKDWRSLAHHTAAEIEKQGIKLLLNHRAEAIDPQHKSVRIISNQSRAMEINWDKLLIATGAESTRPPIEGLDQPGVFFLRWMGDGFTLKKFIEDQNPQQTVIIGGGYIGLEMADALARRGIEVTILEFLPEILSTMDASMGGIVRRELEANGVKVITGKAVKEITHENGKTTVHTATGEVYQTGMALVATGVRPAVSLAKSAGAALGVGGAIPVNQSMATNIPGIYAAGDCVETWHHLLKNKVYMPLGTTAHKQGRIAGENMAGGKAEFQGTLGTQAVKIFGKIAAGTGLRDVQASKAGFNPLTVTITATDRNPYYPGVKDMTLCLTGDRTSGKLLGAQMVGQAGSEIAKRIDIIAAALYNGMAVKDLIDIDLAYSPPLSSPWDPVQKAAMQWLAAVKTT